MTAQEIAAITALIAQIGPLGLNLFLLIQSHLNLGPDTKLNIANAIAASNQADNNTKNAVAQWMVSEGFTATMTFSKA